MVCHLLNCEQNLGRSLVIDVEAPAGKGFRQVDHRTIQSIILKNVKYSLGKKSNFKTFEPKKVDSKTAKWNEKKLAVGNWFSEIQFYQFKNDVNWDRFECAIHNANKDVYEIPRNQIEDMYSGSQYTSEEKISRSNMVELLMNAKECVFTATFRKKIA